MRKWFFYGEKKYFALFVIIVVMVLVVLSAVGYAGYNYVQYDPTFCNSCHLMEDAFIRWNDSDHSDVTCHGCHHQSTEDTLAQSIAFFTKNPTAIEGHAEVESELCVECHDMQTVGHDVHFLGEEIDCVRCHTTSLHRFSFDRDNCMECHFQRELIKEMGTQHCLSCHPFLSGGNESELRPTEESCKECHSDRETKIALSEYHVTSECTTCHRPHEKDRPVECLECHAPQHSGKGHQECTACHIPHQEHSLTESCETCHTDKKTGHYPHLKCDRCHTIT